MFRKDDTLLDGVNSFVSAEGAASSFAGNWTDTRCGLGRVTFVMNGGGNVGKLEDPKRGLGCATDEEALLGDGTGRRSGEAVGEGATEPDGARDPREGGGGGGLLIPVKSEDEDAVRKWRVSACTGEPEPPEVARGRGLVGFGDSPSPMPVCLLLGPGAVSRASCSNLDRKFLTAGKGADSISGCSIDLAGSPGR